MTGFKRSASIIIASLGLCLLAVGGMAACKQGEGERCQTNEDCEEALTCNVAEGVCRESLSSGIDASPPDQIDGPPPDVATDAMLDAI